MCDNIKADPLNEQDLHLNNTEHDVRRFWKINCMIE